MLYGYELLTVVELCLLVYCVLDVVTTPEDRVRNLPKLLWLVLVVLLPLAGGIAWLVAGRPQGAARSLPYRGNAGAVPPAPAARRPPSHPDDDEEFLAQLRRRAEEQRRRGREQDPPQA